MTNEIDKLYEMIGEIEVAMIFTDSSDDVAQWSFWSWGGPNSGSDYCRDEKPAMWAPIESRHWPENARG